MESKKLTINIPVEITIKRHDADKTTLIVATSSYTERKREKYSREEYDEVRYMNCATTLGDDFLSCGLPHEILFTRVREVTEKVIKAILHKHRHAEKFIKYLIINN